MDHSDLTVEKIQKSLEELFLQNPTRERRVIMYTGVMGYDLYEEAVEGEMGYERAYIGKKVPRILRTLAGTIKKSPSDRYYKLIRKWKSTLKPNKES